MPDPDPLLDAYRLIRRVDSPLETPWPGTLAHHDIAGTVLLVEVDALGENWPGWLADADGHILAPADVVRTSDGHLISLTPCTERLEEFLRRREETPLTDGERITLAVSMVRGMADASRLPDSIDSSGEWWLTEGGRPMFALTRVGRPIRDVTHDVLAALEERAGRHLGGVIAEVVETTADSARLSRNHARLEQALFAVGTPEPLATTVFAPRRAREAALSHRPPSFEEVAYGDETLVGRLARHVDADLADAFSQATTALWRRFRAERPHSRRRPLAVAGLVAGAVVAAGLMWPVGGPATAQPDRPSASASAEDQASTEPSANQTPAPADAESSVSTDAAPTVASGLEQVLDDLLTVRAGCQEDPTCLSGVVEESSGALPPGPLDLAAADREIALVDDFGGAAVLRVTSVADEGDVQLVVIVRQDEKWLIRDVHDVADQPQ